MEEPLLTPEPWPPPLPPAPQIAARPQRYVPVATYFLVALNVAMFLIETLAGGSKNTDVLLGLGASFGPYFHRGQYWRLVTPMFLHIGMAHLFFNMLVLYALGPILEQIYGYARFALIYVAAGMSGSFLSMSYSQSVGAGASGAIFGVIGAILVAGFMYRDDLPYPLSRVFRRGRLPVVLLVLVGAEFLIDSSVHGIDSWAHLGGLVGGGALAAVIAPPLQPGPFAARRPVSNAVVLIPIVIVAAAMTAMARQWKQTSAVARLLAEGQHLILAHHPDLALQKFQQAERLAPGDERPHEQLGSLYLAEKRLPDAIREYDQTLRLNPGSPLAALGLALAYQAQGDLPKAQKYFESVLGQNPRNAEAQEELGDLCQGQKLYQPAIEHYRQAIKMDPGLAVAHNNLAWLYATSEDPKFRNPAAALEHAQRAVQLTRWRTPEFIDTLAEALYANRNYAEAVKVQQRALALDPQNREYLEHMARYRKAAGA